MNWKDYVADEYDVSSEEEIYQDIQKVPIEKGRAKIEEVVIKKGDRVKIHYLMRFEDKTIESTIKGKKHWVNVDDSKSRQEPLEIVVGNGDVIRGLDEGLIGMCLYEKAELIISAKYAYGRRGAGIVVPPNTIVHYDVEICSVNEEGSGIGEIEQEVDELTALMNAELPDMEPLVSDDSSEGD